MQISHAMKRILSHAGERRLSVYSAGLGYYLMLALFPLLLFAAAFAGLLGVPRLVREALAGMPLPGDVIRLLSGYLDSLASGDRLWMALAGLGLSLYAFARASRLMMDFAEGSDRARSGLRRQAVSFLFALVLLAAVITLLAGIVLGGTIIDLRFGTKGGTLLRALRYFAAGGLMLFLLMLLYRFASRRPARLAAVLAAASFAMGASIAFSWGFSLYVENFARYSLIYGSLAAFIVLSVWAYAIALILLVGFLICEAADAGA